VKDLKVTETARTGVQTFAYNRCSKAHLPPIPDDVANTLPPEAWK